MTRKAYCVPECKWPHGCHKWAFAYLLANKPVDRCERCGLEVKRDAAGRVTRYRVGMMFKPARRKVRS